MEKKDEAIARFYEYINVLEGDTSALKIFIDGYIKNKQNKLKAISLEIDASAFEDIKSFAAERKRRIDVINELQKDISLHEEILSLDFEELKKKLS